MTGADHRPNITVFPTAPAASHAAAKVIAGLLRETPRASLGLATGGTMIPVYAELVAMVAAGEVSLAQMRSFNLDEYVGLTRDHPQSYRAYMTAHLAGPTGMKPAQLELPSGDAPDPEAEAHRYEALLRRNGPLDLQLLGLGGNGHIGFNEPGSSEDSRTRVVTLAPATIHANARFFGPGEDVPDHAISMGIATILSARRILLVATGASKAAAVRAMIEGEIGPDCPASFLRRNSSVQVILDADAATALAERE